MAHPDFNFTLLATCPETGARAGVIQTPQGQVPTPIFMPVGTQATVKAVPWDVLRTGMDAPIVLANNYHLYLRPGLQTFKDAGGIHKFTGWDRLVLSDSGGYQVFSLAKMRKISDEGVTFKSHIDGSSHLFTPENVVDMQRAIGTDIQMVLDECAPYPCDAAYARNSLTLTYQWAARARKAFLNTEAPYNRPQFQYGIVQGSVYEDLRHESCARIADLDFEGNAIGGLSVGEPPQQMWELAQFCTERLPTHKPRYLMGVGTPEDLVRCIGAGVDQFDCVLPTRNARHGKLYFWDGIRSLKSAKYAKDHRPLDETSELPLDAHSRAYLRHLFAAEEYLAYTIASAHNLYFFLRLVRTAREQILAGTFGPWSREVLPRLAQRAED